MAVKIDKAKNGVTVAMILADSCQSYATGFVFGSVCWQLVFFYPYFLSYLVVYGLFFLKIMRAPTRSRLWLFLQRVNLKEIEMLLVVPSKFDYVMTDDICVRDQISTALEYL